jgi:hypothetical protein
MSPVHVRRTPGLKGWRLTVGPTNFEVEARECRILTKKRLSGTKHGRKGATSGFRGL